MLNCPSLLSNNGKIVWTPLQYYLFLFTLDIHLANPWRGLRTWKHPSEHGEDRPRKYDLNFRYEPFQDAFIQVDTTSLTTWLVLVKQNLFLIYIVGIWWECPIWNLEERSYRDFGMESWLVQCTHHSICFRYRKGYRREIQWYVEMIACEFFSLAHNAYNATNCLTKYV